MKRSKPETKLMNAYREILGVNNPDASSVLGDRTLTVSALEIKLNRQAQALTPNTCSMKLLYLFNKLRSLPPERNDHGLPSIMFPDYKKTLQVMKPNLNA